MLPKSIVIATGITLKNKKQIYPNIFSFVFTPEKPFEWKAGQHVLLSLKTKEGKRLRRAFSVASAPSEGHITITTRILKDEDSAFKLALKQLKKGDLIKLRGPVGPLYIDDNPETIYAFLATGIGIVPFRSIIAEMSAQNTLNNKITLFFAGNKDNHFFREELSEFNKIMPNLTIKYIYKPERLTGSIIEEELGSDVQQTIFLLSGSSKLVKSYRRTLTGLGIPRKNIKSDTFIGVKTPAKLPKLPLTNPEN